MSLFLICPRRRLLGSARVRARMPILQHVLCDASLGLLVLGLLAVLGNHPTRDHVPSEKSDTEEST